jgi:chaperone modulatory protein CbpM
MELQELITVDVFCKECQVELTLIEELEAFGLIEIVRDRGMKYIHSDHLPHVQRIITFHNELNINKEGIEVVLNLLDRLNQSSQEVRYLESKLKLYEER